MDTIENTVRQRKRDNNLKGIRSSTVKNFHDSQAISVYKSKRSMTGKLTKWLFIFFNLAMIYLLIKSGCIGMGSKHLHPKMWFSGAAMDTGLAFFLLASLWAIGDVILGVCILVTRPKSYGI